MKIYLATSWRNESYYRVLNLLRNAGHSVYDFREKAFKFDDIANKPWDSMDWQDQLALLDNPLADEAFNTDFKALKDADVLVMLYPCGNDAHTELGYAAALGQYTVIYVQEGYNVGLMDKVADRFVTSDQQLLEELRS